ANGVNGAYGVPADNPFVNAPGLDEIFAYGLRNPFRFSFHPDTGALIVSDVGQNDVEEVNVVQAGDNLGWRLKEGSPRFVPNGAGSGFVTSNMDGLPGDLVDPVIEYDHDEGISIIGGHVYRGTEIDGLQGRYVFADFSLGFFFPRGRLFHGDLTTGEIRTLKVTIRDEPLGLFVKGFGEDAAGNLYLCAGVNLGPFGTNGNVYRIVPACPVDFAPDRELNIFDVIEFLGLFDAQDPLADFNGDTVFDIFDVTAFLEAFAIGC
ncbi:MAG: PQQ-dependent sugar dehydrogenase, partial [Phycisphaerales bacterium]|nr:PQQ-dependent sugar dehydrogenase [Phycisphaerales bacterium]